jgi:predicted nucleic acid-binding protein
LGETRIEELTYALYLKKLDISARVAIKASEFKGKYAVSIADAFIAATAYFEDATAISDDPDFGKIPEIKVKTEKEFCQSLDE